MQVKFTIIFVNIVATLVVLFMAANPFWGEVMTNRKNIKKTENEIASSQNILEKTKQIKEIEKEVKKVFKALPSKIDTPELMDSFQKLANNNQLILESIGFSDIENQDQKEGKESFPSLTLDMSLSGAFYNSEARKNPNLKKADFISFLCDLENIARAMDISTIDFETYRYASESRGQDFTYNLTIKVYYQ